MMRIATLAVAVSSAVSIITLAVVFGFRTEVSRAIKGSVADVVVTDLRSLNTAQAYPIAQSQRLTDLISPTEGVEGIATYIMQGCVLRSAQQSSGVVVKGLSSAERLEWFKSRLCEGALPHIEGNRKKELLVPQSLATKAAIKPGDKVEILLLEGKQPVRDLFKVCGTYASTGDDSTAPIITDIRNLQKLNGWSNDTISGIEITLAEGASAAETTERINRLLWEVYDGEENLSAVATEELYAALFAWLGTHDVNAAVIVSIMLIVALFNMITTMLILVLERTRTIGILKALGMGNRQVRYIFLYQAARLTLRGLLLGNIIGVGLVALQHYTGLFTLDPAAYFVSAVPVSLGIGDLLLLDAGSAVVILILLFGATAITSRISPAVAVKYE